MKVIELGTGTATFKAPVLRYAVGRYDYRVRLPVTAAVVDVHSLARGSKAITFGSFNGAVVSVSGPALIIDAIFEAAGG